MAGPRHGARTGAAYFGTMMDQAPGPRDEFLEAPGCALGGHVPDRGDRVGERRVLERGSEQEARGLLGRVERADVAAQRPTLRPLDVRGRDPGATRTVDRLEQPRAERVDVVDLRRHDRERVVALGLVGGRERLVDHAVAVERRLDEAAVAEEGVEDDLGRGFAFEEGAHGVAWRRVLPAEAHLRTADREREATLRLRHLRGLGRGAPAVHRPGGVGSQDRLGPREHRRRVDVARDREDEVRGVVVGGVRAHEHVAVDRRDRLLRARGVEPDRVVAVERAEQPEVAAPRRVVVVHRDLLPDDPLLARDRLLVGVHGGERLEQRRRGSRRTARCRRRGRPCG